MAGLSLEPADRRRLDGREGEALRLAMRVVAGAAAAAGADRLIDVSSAHVDGCLYQGRVSLDFAERLVSGGARVAVPTTLNVGSVDLLHPELYRGGPDDAARGRRLMELYAAMGARPTWTCAPYQAAHRPAFGEHVAWAESNAIVFANSVLGARTDRYGDFIDVCAALTGRAPYAGLHRPENRRGEVLFRLRDVPGPLLHHDVLYPVLGHLVGEETGSQVPVIEGLPPNVSEDRLKALGAAAASSGSVGLFHAVGRTPEAPDVGTALGGVPPERVVEVSLDALVRVRDALSTVAGGTLAAVSLGTPHFSVSEFAALAGALDGLHVHPDVPLYVSTGRDVLDVAERQGWAGRCRAAGVTIVTDTCTYVTPILGPVEGVVMTNSGKWAYYAPGNIGVAVVFGSLRECVRSAVEGTVWRDPDLWRP